MFQTAQRKKSKLRLGVSGASGTGKTMGSLKLARGLASSWEKVFVIDTEHGSAELYSHLGPYQVAVLTAPFAPERYIELMKEAFKAGAEVVVCDSLSHAWEGSGGVLEKVDQAAAKSQSKNSFTAWKDVTPIHRQLVETMLQAPCHVIATLRSKQEYVMETDQRTGKQTVRKVGMKPIQRDGMEYEFTAFVEVNDSHQATATKDRTGLLDGRTLMLSEDLGSDLLEWLESGAEPTKAEPSTVFLSHRKALEEAKDLGDLGQVFSKVKTDRAKLTSEELAELVNLKEVRKTELNPVPAGA